MSVKTINQRRERAERDWQKLQSSTRPVIYVGAGSCGRAAGALEVLEAIKGHLKKRKVNAKVVEVGCIGPCYLEPLVDIQMPNKPRVSYSNIAPKHTVRILDAFFEDNGIPRFHLAGHFGEAELDGVPRFFDHPMLAPQVRIVLRNCGIIDPEDIDHYLAREGYKAIEKCLSMEWRQVIEIVKDAGLRGRGGAGFPTWRKWLFCRETESDQRYLICNADEGDPGAFMNRSLIEGDPHALLEGMLIAAYAIGASKGFIYIRAEYPLAIERLKGAIVQMRELGLVSASTSRSRKGPGRSSAVRRRPSSHLSKGKEGCRARGRPSRLLPGCGANPRSSTMSRRSEPFPISSATAPNGTISLGRRHRRERRRSASSERSGVRDSSKFRSG